jgi:hypothetical protein
MLLRVVFDLSSNRIGRSNRLNTQLSVLIPVAEIDWRLAGINHFSASTGDGSRRQPAFGFSRTTATPWPEPMHTPTAP